MNRLDNQEILIIIDLILFAIATPLMFGIESIMGSLFLLLPILFVVLPIRG